MRLSRYVIGLSRVLGDELSISSEVVQVSVDEARHYSQQGGSFLVQEQAFQALVALCDSLGTLPGCSGPADDSGPCAM